jgi:SAM-dependent methyltransferase
MSAFGAQFFKRFYFDPATRVTSAAEMRDRASLIIAALRHARIPVRRILDAGCGVGLLHQAFAKVAPRISYTGLEHSEYLCKRYGWKRGSVVDFKARAPFDLVVCYDVLQYLGREAARQAIAKLALVCRGALYFGALTSGDWRHNCDQSRTDRVPGIRSAAWYRRELARGFKPLGCGMWLRHGAPVTAWDLDRVAP